MIENYATLVLPLQKLKHQNKFVWSDKCQDSFVKIRDILCASPVIHMPNPNCSYIMRSFVIQCDASDKGMGAVLLQRDEDNNEYVIEYASKSFTDCQLRYATIKKEATALLWSIEHFNHYLYGRKFLVESDHRPLQWLMTKKDSVGSLGRMALRLQQYDFDVVHIPGRNNIIADALSRVFTIQSKPWNDVQESDDSLQNQIESNPQLFWKDGSVWYKKENDVSKLCLPIDLLNERIHQIHSSLGHVGIQKTSEFMKLRYYHPKLKERIKSLINSCSICQQTKDYDNQVKLRHNKIDYSSLEINDTWSIDICDMNSSKRNNRYLIACIDLSSKWVEACSTKTATAKKVIFFLNKVFKTRGIPKNIISDRGSIFESTVYNEFCAEKNIHQKFAVPYLHQTNGSIERFFRSFRNIVRSMKIQDEWDKKLNEVLKIYNNTIHTSTGFTPSQLLHGNHEKFECDISDPIDQKLFEKDPIRIANWRTQAKMNLKKNYQSDLESKFKINDYVLIRRKHVKNQPWLGPFKIVETKGSKLFEIAGQNQKKLIVHNNQMKLYINDCTDSDLINVPSRGRPRELD